MADRWTALTAGSWWRVLLVGALAWAGGIAVTAYTRDPILLPGVFLLGSFLVPFALLVALLERTTRLWMQGGDGTALVPYRVLLAFAGGGALGVWPAAFMEYLLGKVLPDAYFIDVAVSEEVVKLVIVAALAAGLGWYRRRDGMVLGAAVGLGFSAFESFGYAYLLTKSEHSLDVPAIVANQLSRGILTPVGHALWTSLAAGALFAAAAAAGRLRVTASVIGWLAVAVVLHTGWDASSGFAAWLVAQQSGQDIDLAQFRIGTVPNPTASESAVLGVLRSMLLAFNAGVGLLLARWQWRRPGAPPPAGQHRPGA